MNFLTKFNPLYPHQFCSQPGYSSEPALINFIEKIKQNIYDGLTIGALVSNLTKPFHTIIHCMLIHKLESLGIICPLLELIHSYLSNRSQVDRQ